MVLATHDDAHPDRRAPTRDDGPHSATLRDIAANTHLTTLA
jgi:hypothetical protein